ncbi:TPA: hypothetical protein PFE07_002480 [Kluyvera cryocrescens]|nr:hypothetical protein [Kluyvera cryocrescens]
MNNDINLLAQRFRHWSEMAALTSERVSCLSVEQLEEIATVLESRTVTVKLPKRSVGEVMHMSGFSRDYAEGWCSGNDNAIHELKQMGIAVVTDGCGHSSVFWDVSGVKRCSLCDVAIQVIEGEQKNG